jgi:hypothetical protein
MILAIVPVQKFVLQLLAQLIRASVMHIAQLILVRQSLNYYYMCEVT